MVKKRRGSYILTLPQGKPTPRPPHLVEGVVDIDIHDVVRAGDRLKGRVDQRFVQVQNELQQHNTAAIGIRTAGRSVWCMFKEGGEVAQMRAEEVPTFSRFKWTAPGFLGFHPKRHKSTGHLTDHKKKESWTRLDFLFRNGCLLQ